MFIFEAKDMLDVLDFKINIFPLIAKFLFYILAFTCFVWGLAKGFEINYEPVAIFWLVFAFIAPIFLHCIFEGWLVRFVILDILREIRDNMSKTLENK